jgi:hypothetical protein
MSIDAAQRGSVLTLAGRLGRIGISEPDRDTFGEKTPFIVELVERDRAVFIRNVNVLQTLRKRVDGLVVVDQFGR